MSFRLVPKSVTLNDLTILHCVISLNLVNLLCVPAHSLTASICGRIYFVHESVVFCSARMMSS